MCPPESPKTKRNSSSLFELCFKTIVDYGVPYKDLDPRLHFYSALESATPCYSVNPPPPRRAQRYQEGPLPKTIFLSTATLVVVPDTLIQQWSAEILKHVHDNALNYLVISKPTQPIPSPSELMKLDLLLLSYNRFAKEEDDGKFHYRFLLPCIHYAINCPCQDVSESPLLQIHWKRLIVDEGHVLGQSSARIVSLAGKLRVERRWCVTGTISNQMMGMELGMVRTLSDTAVSVDSSTETSTPEDLPSRKPEQIDLKRLGAIVIDYLHSPPFDKMALWNMYVVKPYTENHRGSMSSLRNIMSIMIRHPPNEIEKDIKLPPLHINTVVLHPTRENRLSINVITALIALNAVLSQRTDQDYIFHPAQVKSRDEVVRNLMMAMLHFNGTSMDDVLNAIRRGTQGLEKSVENSYSEEDTQLLKTAIGCLKEAVEDETWRTMAVRPQQGKEEDSGQEMGIISGNHALTKRVYSGGMS
jgi:SNF2-related domain